MTPKEMELWTPQLMLPTILEAAASAGLVKLNVRRASDGGRVTIYGDRRRRQEDYPHEDRRVKDRRKLDG